MASLVEPILNEFRDEVPATRRLLERVPADKLAWKPHPKSRSLGELAMHVASIPGMAEKIANSDEFAASTAQPSVSSVDEIRARFEKSARTAEEVLSKMTEQSAQGSWRLTFNGKTVFSKPRFAVLRTSLLNHLYHHRGQLSVYLRLLDVAVPVVYGPTADENPFG